MSDDKKKLTPLEMVVELQTLNENHIKDKRDHAKEMERIRNDFQSELKVVCGFKYRLPNDNENRSKAMKVAVLIDFPRVGISDAIINLVDENSKKIEEVNLSSMSEGSEHGWISSLSPRIYLNTDIILEKAKPSEYDMLQILKHIL